MTSRQEKARPSRFVPAVYQYAGSNEPYRKFLSNPVSMTAWTHESRTSNDDVIIDMSLLPSAKDGDVAELRIMDGNSKKLYFIVNKMSDEIAKLMPNVQISILSGNLVKLLDMPPRGKVGVKLIDKDEVEADLVELYFKDTYLTRADMWRIASSLTSTCLYSSQRVTYCNMIRANVKEIYRYGRKVFSAYIGPKTKIIYRSESARAIYFIQMSSEMWHFEENGELMFHKLVNSFFPEVFRRWRQQGAHHTVTIVLFTSVDISEQKSELGHGKREKNVRDYFRVVVDQIHISRWNDIMATLRFEFTKFAQDVLQQENGKVEGRILPAVKGNLMEAISLATSLISSKFNDRDLRQTNVQVIIVTPGSGIYDVDYDLLYQTSTKLLSIEISIDLVCLSRPPLHVTPLFRYKDYDGPVVNCIPSWLDISFWKSTEQYANQWIPRCKIYEIQMMGVMENEFSALSIGYLAQESSSRSLDKIMDKYDSDIFETKQEIASKRIVEDAVINAATSALLRPRVSSADLTTSKNNRYAESSSTVTIPAAAIISNPSLDDEMISTTASLINTTKKTKPQQTHQRSALSTLFALGTYSNSSSTQSSPKRSEFAHLAALPAVMSPKLSALGEDNASTKGDDIVESSITAEPDHLAALRGASMRLHAHLNAESQPQNNERFADGPLPIKKQRPFLDTRQSLTNSVRKVSDPTDAVSTLRNKISSSKSPQDGSGLLSKGHHDSRKETEKEKEKTKAKAKESGDIDENNYIWVTISNASNMLPDAVMNISNYGRWKDVFPRGVRRRAVKWRSLRSPASLPLATELFPSVREFEANYTFQIYDVTLDTDQEESLTPGDLLEEMVALRLRMGFQIVIGDKVRKIEALRPGGDPTLIVQTIPQDFKGVRLYMTRSNQIHRLACDHYGTINVQLYRKDKVDTPDFSRTYHPLIKTKYESKYEVASGNFFDPSVRMVNWNLVDQQLAGFEDLISEENSKMFKIRFVLIPTNKSLSAVSAVPSFNENKDDKLTKEETLVEGIRKIIAQIYKGRYMTFEEKRRTTKNGKKQEIPPETKFYTGDLPNFLLQLLDTYNSYTDDPTVRYSGAAGRKRDSLFVKETLTRSVKLNQLAIEMQSEKGIRLVDRRWHWKTHKNCFVGQEFAAWMMHTFADIDTVEEAVDFGNELMEQGLFHHVENRHLFLDGHYFYQLNSQYVFPTGLTEKQGGWFGKKSADSSTTGSASSTSTFPPTTPNLNPQGVSGSTPQQPPKSKIKSSTSLAEMVHGHTPRNSDGIPESMVSENSDSVSPSINTRISALNSSSNSALASPMQDNSPVADKLSTEQLPKVLLSRSIVYDIDPTKKSYRPEFLTIHADRVHNPDNAFQIRFEWINATPRLIEDCINNFSRLGERHGLKMVQVPIDEISSIPNGNPFCSLIRTRFAVDVTKLVKLPEFAEVGDPLVGDPLYYHKFALAKAGFVLDTEAASNLARKEMDITYSWGRPYYKYTQFVHRSGIVVAQIVEDEEIIMMTNTLHVSRLASYGGIVPPLPESETSSSTDDLYYLHEAPKGLNISQSERIQLRFKRSCESENRLQLWLTEAQLHWVARKKGGVSNGSILVTSDVVYPDSSGSSTPRMARSVIFDEKKPL